MKTICNTNGIISPDFPNQGIIDISYSEFNDILLDLGFEYLINKPVSKIIKSMSESPDEFERYHIGLIEKLKAHNLTVCACKAPYIEFFDDKTVILNIIMKCIKICKNTNCKYLVLNPFIDDETFYQKLCNCAKENDIVILIENSYRNFNGHFMRGKWSDSRQIVKFIDKMNDFAEKEVFGCCVNTVNLNLCCIDMHEFIKTIGSRIKMIIISECDGHNKTYALPFTLAYNGSSQTDWCGLIRGIHESSFDGLIALDIADTVCAFPPLLRPSMMILAKKTVEYFLWQLKMENTIKKYPNIVLFGAGNMFKNYMTLYGKKYPPKFTCDNNSKLWGQKIHGVEVKSPEVLANIPENYVVFICNIYYRDIEKQLRNIGVKNIEYFNDEYLPISEE